MNLFKKLAINVTSHADTIANHFENKEAISAAYIREYERAVARAQVKLTDATAEVASLEKKIKRQDDLIKTWTERARRTYSTDESTALECVARIQTIKPARQQLIEHLEEARTLQHRISQDVDVSLRKLDSLKRRQQNLTSRQVCTDASNVLHHADDSLQDDIDGLFSRWETEVVAQELHQQGAAVSNDILAEQFETEEQNKELRLILDQIVASNKPEEEKSYERNS